MKFLRFALLPVAALAFSGASFERNLDGVPDRAYQRHASQKGRRVRYGDPDGPILLPHKSAQWFNEGGPEVKKPAWQRDHGVANQPIRQQRNEVPPRRPTVASDPGSYSRSDYEILKPNRSSQWLQTLPEPSQTGWRNLPQKWEGMNENRGQSPISPQVRQAPPQQSSGGAWSSLADEWNNMNQNNEQY